MEVNGIKKKQKPEGIVGDNPKSIKQEEEGEREMLNMGVALSGGVRVGWWEAAYPLLIQLRSLRRL